MVASIECHNRAGQREHFGFADGAGQPAIEGSGHTHLPGQGQPWNKRGWRPLKAGEFVLGYEDEDGIRPAAPGARLGDNGSYMVLRKLEQNVARFRSYVTEAANTSGMARDLLAAKLVGRWQDGTPLALSPDRPDPRISGSPRRINDFRYRRDDPDGFRCPVGAHIRRVNPRDDMDPHGLLSQRHRMIRRGMPYGKPLPEGETDDESRGLVFVCYVASIERQFEFVQGEWCNDGDSFDIGTDRDLIAGMGAVGNHHADKLTIRGRTPVFLEAPTQPLVVNRGGGYFFAPGIRALRAITTADW
jgi:Dyp-type peroxidase family